MESLGYTLTGDWHSHKEKDIETLKGRPYKDGDGSDRVTVKDA